MKIHDMIDSDWNEFYNFVLNNLPNTFVSDKKFNKYWFRRLDGSWTIQIARNSLNKISAINMYIETKGLLNKIKSPFIWTSAAFANEEAKKTGVVGIMLFNLHRKFPIIGSTCANDNSLPINEALGKKIQGVYLKRFIYIHSYDCLNIVEKKNYDFLKKNIRIVKRVTNNNLFKEWSNKIPKDINKLWLSFSKKFQYCINKDYNYLNWRYVNIPYQKYQILTIRNKNKELIGLSIMRFQKTNFGICARIVDFMAMSKYHDRVWNEILIECENKKSLFTDFFVIGDSQSIYLNKNGFNEANNKNKLNSVPNLLSPIEYRQWSNTFHLGGYLLKNDKERQKNDKVWFTKGDGDRDFPTSFNIKNDRLN